jgi:nicotinamidase-related amidase
MRGTALEVNGGLVGLHPKEEPMRRIAILTSDLQWAAANKHPARRRAVDAFLPTLTRFLRRGRELGVPVIHLQLVIPTGDRRSVGLPDELRFEKGSAGSQMLAEVLEPGDIVVEKPKDSGFFETTLDAQLKDLGVETVILCGMQAQICIQTTAADAFFRGYQVVVASDGVTSTLEDDMSRALEWMGSYCATILTCADIEAELASANPSFPRSGHAA